MGDPRKDRAPLATSVGDGGTDVLPSHIESTLAAITRLHDTHRRGASPVHRAVEGVTLFVASPGFAGLIAAVVVVWTGANSLAPAFALKPIDPWPFNGLEGIAGVTALFMTVFILITERRENELSELRGQLTLELAMLSEQKTAKLISLIEELRRDMPTVPDRADQEAEDLSRPADPEAVLEALRETQAEVPAKAQAPARVQGLGV
jgi:uncharacterized membrane protein